MREEEFTAHAGARWPALVRSLVLMGFPVVHAEALAVEALARLRASWAEREDWLDLDVPTYRALLEARRIDRRPWWEGPLDDVAPGGSGLADVAPVLDRLSVDARWRLILDTVAGLSPEQVDDVVPGVDSTSPPAVPAAALQAIAQDVPVGPPLVAAASAVAARRRRTRSGATALVVGVLVAVLGVGAAYATHEVTQAPAAAPSGSVTPVPDRSSLPPGVPGIAGPGVPVAWYARGRLHLGRRVVSVPGVTAVTDVGSRAVVRDARGRLSVVSRSGPPSMVGRTSTAGRVVADSTSDFAAWVEPGRRGRRTVVLFDVGGGHVALRRITDGPARVVAVDGDRVFWSDAGGTHRAAVDVDTSDLATVGLLDVRGSVRARQVDATHIIVEHLEGDAVGREVGSVGVGARISEDGRYVLSRVGAGDPFVVDDYSGLRVRLPVPPVPVVTAAFGPGGTVTLVLRRTTLDDGEQHSFPSFHPPPAGGGYELVTCALDQRTCYPDTRLAGLGGPPPLLGQ